MYAKVFAQIYDGTLCTRGPWEALVTFQQFLVLADMDGVVDMTPAAIARRTTIPLEIIERGIGELVKPDHESRTPTEEGRRLVPLAEGRSWGWRVVNYAHYRELKREEDRREYHRQYWHKRKLKSSTDSTDSTETQHAQQNQPKQKQKQKQKQEEITPPDVSVAVWNDWCALRKSKRAAVTATCIDGIRREAEKAGITLEAAMAMACHRGWVGFKAEWLVESKGVGAEPDWVREKRERVEAFCGPSKRKEIIDVDAKILG